MGTPAKADVVVTFTGYFEAECFLRDFKNWLEKRVLRQIDSDLPDDTYGDYDVSDYEVHENELSFKVYSGRVVNAEWQLENISKFFKEHGACRSFTSQLWVMSDNAPYWNKDEE